MVYVYYLVYFWSTSDIIITILIILTIIIIIMEEVSTRGIDLTSDCVGGRRLVCRVIGRLRILSKGSVGF